jgi:hypothetical protein
VNDVRHTCEALLNLRTQEPVSVRDDSNSKHCANRPSVPNRTGKNFGSMRVDTWRHVKLTLPQRESPFWRRLDFEEVPIGLLLPAARACFGCHFDPSQSGPVNLETAVGPSIFCENQPFMEYGEQYSDQY